MTANRSILKKCPACQKKFVPDPRVGARQRYCCDAACQKKRQRGNESAWRVRNPECVCVQKRKWREKYPTHLKDWRKRHPEAVERNRAFMRRHMRGKREREMFEKSKEIRLQLSGKQGDVYVSRGGGWFFARLKRASLWSKGWVRRYACGRVEAKNIRMPRGRLYDFSGVY